ncbi:MAG: C40 family peptidase [Deltaproteobacteria bacterium]|nr:C40 family peptidase [Deltaproteobacteria bacterium]
MRSRLLRVMRAAFVLGALAIPASATAAGRQNVAEFLQATFAKDKGLSPEERASLLAAIKERFASYADTVVHPEKGDMAAVLNVISEGKMDELSDERIADVAFAAYQAIYRGADTEVVQGIALYGYRKKVDAERIAQWANGYRLLTTNHVPDEVAADLVRVAMEKDWDEHAFDTIKWALVSGVKAGHDPRLYAATLFSRLQKDPQHPGTVVASTATDFARAAKTHTTMPDPGYKGVFSLKKDDAGAGGKPATDEAQAAREAKAQKLVEQANAEKAQAAERAQKAREQADAQEKSAEDDLARARKAEQAQKDAMERASGKADAKEQSEAKARADAERVKREKAEAAAAAAKARAEAARAKAEAAKQAAAKAKAQQEAERQAAIAAEKSGSKPAPAGKSAEAVKGAEIQSKVIDDIWPGLEHAARSYIGTPYVWGGVTHEGIDCSGFTKGSYNEVAVTLPRVAKDQWTRGTKIEEADLRKGDLIFFDTLGTGVSHVALMVDPANHKFIHAGSSKGVIEENLAKTYFQARYLGARRIVK